MAHINGNEIYFGIIGKAGNGGGGGITTKELLDSPVIGGEPGMSSGTITLNDDITKYDALEFRVGVYASDLNQFFTNTILVEDIYNITSNAFFIGGMITADQNYCVYYLLRCSNSTELTIESTAQIGWSETRTIFGIKGIKF